MDTFGTPRATRTLTEQFGDATKLMLDAKAVVNVAVPEMPAGAHARLRLGLLGPTGSEPICVSWNGRELPTKPTALQELPLDRAEIQPLNRLEVWCRQPSGNPCLALAFASVVVESVEKVTDDSECGTSRSNERNHYESVAEDWRAAGAGLFAGLCSTAASRLLGRVPGGAAPPARLR